MLKFSKLRITNTGMVIQNVKILFKLHPTVKDYMDEIQQVMKKSKNSFFVNKRDIWIYSNGFTIGYIKLKPNGEFEYYFNGNKDVWDSEVIKCRSIVGSSGEYLYKLWLKDQLDYALVRPKDLPYMFIKSFNRQEVHI